MADIKISLTYDDLKKLIHDDDQIVLEIRKGIVATFTQEYLHDVVRGDIAKIDNGSITKAIHEEFEKYFTTRNRYGSYSGLSADVKKGIDDYMLEVQEGLIKTSNAATVAKTMKLVTDAKEDLLFQVGKAIETELIKVTEEYVRQLVIEHIDKIYGAIRDTPPVP